VARPRTVSDDVVVDAPPETLYALVADPAQMARWSPENTGATTTHAGPAEVGDRFVGTNRRGPATWVTESVVTAAEPGRRFAFTVRGWGVRQPSLRVRNASWEYRFEPVGDGTRVVETWTDDRPWPDAVANVVDRVLTRGSTFAAFQRGNIRRTLDRLKADVESPGSGG
jgi:uncharacterized protein YndB with AHSA1/START domain